MTEVSVGGRLSKIEMAAAVLQNDVKHILDETLPAIKKDTKEIIVHVKETNGRLSHLETWQQRIIGSTGAIIFIVSVFGVYALTQIF